MRKIFIICMMLLCMVTDIKPITLMWDMNLEQDVSGYNIYWATNVNGPFTISKMVSVGLTNTVTINNTNFIPNIAYYFCATATNIIGLESTYSNQVIWTNLVAPSVVKGVRVTAR